MPSSIDKHLGRAVRRRRLLIELTQAQVAALVGVRHQQVQKYEAAENAMSASRIWQIACALRSPVGDFYSGLEALS